MGDKLNVAVALTIFVRTKDDSAMPNRCGFFDKDGVISLPTSPVLASKYAHEVALELTHLLVPVDRRLLSITPIGFFDPIVEAADQPERTILLGYRLIVSPGMPVVKNLEFKNYDELKIAAQRISPSHLRVFRAGYVA